MSKYNGWSNHMTWAVNLYIQNDSGSYSDWQSTAHECLMGVDSATAVTLLTKELELAYQRSPRDLGGMDLALWQAATREVNWPEIATALIESIIDSQETLPREVIAERVWDGKNPDTEPRGE